MITYLIAAFSFLYGLVTSFVVLGLIESTTIKVALHDPVAGVFCMLAGLFLLPIGGDRMERQFG